MLLCAADTFRAAAIEQLEIWGRAHRLAGRPPGRRAATPARCFSTPLNAARARGMDYVIVDTAGRLQTKENLMAELQKMSRTARKVIPEAPHEVLLVLDATTGQNGLEQARKFTETSRRDRHRADQAGRHGQGRHRGGHRARAEPAHPLRGRGREGRRPAAVRCREVHRIAFRNQ